VKKAKRRDYNKVKKDAKRFAAWLNGPNTIMENRMKITALRTELKGPTGKIITKQSDKPLLNQDGSPKMGMLKNGMYAPLMELEPWTVKVALIESLETPIDSDKNHGWKKAKELGDLCARISAQDEEVEVSADEIVLLKDRIDKAFLGSVSVCWAMVNHLENPPTPAPIPAQVEMQAEAPVSES
jgi:hypothetical protein